MVRSTRGWALAVLLLVASGCGGQDLTPPTTPTPPDPTTVVFSSTLNPNSAKIHAFSTLAGGTVTATLAAISETVRVGLDLGTWNGNSCHIIIAKDDAVQGAVVVGTVASAGNLCIRVYDVGSFTAATSYDVVVVHP